MRVADSGGSDELGMMGVAGSPFFEAQDAVAGRVAAVVKAGMLAFETKETFLEEMRF